MKMECRKKRHDSVSKVAMKSGRKGSIIRNEKVNETEKFNKGRQGREGKIGEGKGCSDVGRVP